MCIIFNLFCMILFPLLCNLEHVLVCFFPLNPIHRVNHIHLVKYLAFALVYSFTFLSVVLLIIASLVIFSSHFLLEFLFLIFKMSNFSFSFFLFNNEALLS